LLCPTLATTTIPADAASLDELVDVGNETLPWPETLMTLPFNVIGRAPVLALPSGTAANGIPTGVQIVGRTYDDQNGVSDWARCWSANSPCGPRTTGGPHSEARQPDASALMAGKAAAPPGGSARPDDHAAVSASAKSPPGEVSMLNLPVLLDGAAVDPGAARLAGGWERRKGSTRTCCVGRVATGC